MRIQHETTSMPVLLLEPNLANAAWLASRLEAASFPIRMETNAHTALQALRKTSFFALIVVADLTNEQCLATLRSLRRGAPRSWMIVAVPRCDVCACKLIHRCGGDACIAEPMSLQDLVHRLNAFQLCDRPGF